MSDTPETDAQDQRPIRVVIKRPDGTTTHYVPANFARKLERERNDALNKAHNYEQGYLTHATRADTLEKERDEAREERDQWKTKFIKANKDYGFELMDPCGTIWDHAKRLQQERDEAREALDNETQFHHRTHGELVKAQCALMDARAALQRLADCDWVITPLDRMDAVRKIARDALEAAK